jgi:hypothetical protein
MTHLTHDQLSAFLDGELTGTQADDANTHLATCDACSAQLAELAGQGGDIQGVLTHDPGEAYFATFADRVSEKIAAAAAPARVAAASPAAPKRSWWQNLFSPRGMMLAGAAAAFVIVAALAVQLQSHGPQEMAAKSAPQSSMLASPRNEAAAPEAGATPAPAAPAESPAKDASPMEAKQKADVPPRASLDRVAKKEAEATNAPRAQAQPGRAQEMRTLDNGEQVPVSRGPAAAQRAEANRLQDANGGAFRKPAATPLGAQATQGFAAAPPAQAPAQAPVPAPVTVGRVLAEKSIAPANKQRDDKAADGLSLNTLALRAGGAQPAREEDGVAQQAPPMALRLCGRVADPQGRAVPGAVVTLSESGVSTKSDADGSFCVDSPSLSGTVLVFAVGYEPYRYTIRGSASAQALSATLTPISALGDVASGHAMRLKTAPAPGTSDPFAGASLAARTAVAGAQKAETAAAQAHSAGAWSLAAAQWTQAATLLTGAGAHEARFRAAAARMQVLPLAPDAMEPLAAARAALQSFLATAPKGAQRDQATRWLARIQR